MMIRVAKTMDDWISWVAVEHDLPKAPCRSAGGRAASSRSRRAMFSTSMMASSTSAPTAMAMPPRVMVLMLAPRASSTSTAASSESGIASTVMAVAAALIRKAKTISTTSRAPSRRAVSTLATAKRMKSAWRKSRVSISIPAGRPAWISARTSSSRSVSSRVLASGCFWIARTTAG